MTKFDWDKEKDEGNRTKHGIDFATAQLVFDDPYHVSFVANIVEGEERWTAIGLVGGVIVLFVVHTYREHPPNVTRRIISARRATTHERKLYAKANS
ncbi:MAG: BrnT family toxin [Bryobacteraceae bacterium]